MKLSCSRILEAKIKAVVETTEGVRLQVSFGEQAALIYLWQIVRRPGPSQLFNNGAFDGSAGDLP